MNSNLRRGTASLAVVLLSGCYLFDPNKNHCVSSNDCLNGYICSIGTCVTGRGGSWDDGGGGQTTKRVRDYFADIDGDGKVDLISIPQLRGEPNSGQVYVRRSTGVAYENSRIFTSMLDSDVDDRVYFVDVNGDKKADLIAIPPPGRANSGQVFVGLSTGTAFAGWTSTTAMLDSDVDDRIYFADVDGDGRADLITIPPPARASSGRVFVGLSTGSAFANWTSETAMLDSDVDDRVYFADVDGNGRADLITTPPPGRANSGRVFVGLSTGDAFSKWTSETAMLDSDIDDRVYFADVDGNGRVDLVTTPPPWRANSGRVFVGLSTGDAFSNWTSETAMLDSDVDDRIYFADVDGDGRADLVATPPPGRANSGQVSVGLSTGAAFEYWSWNDSRGPW